MRLLGQPPPAADRPSVDVAPSLRFSGPPASQEALPPREAQRYSGNAIVLGLDADDYHADPCEVPSLSASIAHTIVSESPAHARERHPRLGRYQPAERSDTMRRGEIIHALLLGEHDRLRVVDVDSWRTKEARALRDSFAAERLIPVTRREYDDAIVTANGVAANLIDLGFNLASPRASREVSLFWEDTTAGELVQCRGRADYLEDTHESALFLDLKTTASAHPDDIAQSIYRYGYDIQRAAYVRALETIRPSLAGRVDFVFLFVELAPPYAVTPVTLDGSFYAMGEARWSSALATWARCTSTDRWPSYRGEAATVTVSPPQWAMNKAMEAAYVSNL